MIPDSVPCPHCHATIGEPCPNRKTPHVKRINRANIAAANPTSYRDGWPVAKVIRVRLTQVTILCPYCWGEHFHGAPEPGWTHRVSHCPGYMFNAPTTEQLRTGYTRLAAAITTELRTK